MLKITKQKALYLLAAGALLGCVAAAGTFLSGQSANAATPAIPGTAQAGEETEVIVFTVRLPADAILLIDDFKSPSTGEVRTFRTPPLSVGGHYAYTLKAKSRDKEVTRQIHLGHGHDNTFDLRPEFLPAAKDKVHAKLFTASDTQEMLIETTINWGASLHTVEEALVTQPPYGSQFPK